MIRAVVFDFDGVLADSEPLHLAAYQDVFGDLGVELTRDDYYAHYLGYDDDGVFRRMAAVQGWDLGDDQVAALIARKSAAFDEITGRTEVLYPGARECVLRLADAYPLGIASGALTREIQGILRRAGLLDRFKFIVGAGDTPESKPAPDPYLRAAELHRVAPAACVALEDSRWGIVSARAAGLKCVGITHTYDASQLTEADHVIGSLNEFTPELISRLAGQGRDGDTIRP